MKKYFLMAVVLPLFAGVCFTSCKDDDPDDLIVGTWNAKNATYVEYENGAKVGEEINDYTQEYPAADFFEDEIPDEYIALLANAKVKVNASSTFSKNGNYTSKYGFSISGVPDAIKQIIQTALDRESETETGTYKVDGKKLTITYTYIDEDGESEISIQEFTIKSIEKKKLQLESVYEDEWEGYTYKYVSTINLTK
jgi:hypothetical protein